VSEEGSEEGSERVRKRVRKGVRSERVRVVDACCCSGLLFYPMLVEVSLYFKPQVLTRRPSPHSLTHPLAHFF
jgi:hypothetical protein